MWPTYLVQQALVLAAQLRSSPQQGTEVPRPRVYRALERCFAVAVVRSFLATHVGTFVGASVARSLKPRVVVVLAGQHLKGRGREEGQALVPARSQVDGCDARAGQREQAALPQAEARRWGWLLEDTWCEWT